MKYVIVFRKGNLIFIKRDLTYTRRHSEAMLCDSFDFAQFKANECEIKNGYDEGTCIVKSVIDENEFIATKDSDGGIF